jgi:hypothetical protein
MKRILCSCLGLGLLAWTIWAVAVAQEPSKAAKKAAEGGYGESSWTPTESGWLIKATSVHSDGSIASATNHIEPTGLDRYVFRSVDRVVGNEVLPPVEVHVVKQPPQPKSP